MTYDIGATYYVYPGVSSFNYVEFTGKLGTTYGPPMGRIASYVPSQDNTGNNDNFYLGTNASLVFRTRRFRSSIGFEDGAFGDEKLDWSLGMSADVAGFTLGASYVDTNRGDLCPKTALHGGFLARYTSVVTDS